MLRYSRNLLVSSLSPAALSRRGVVASGLFSNTRILLASDNSNNNDKAKNEEKQKNKTASAEESAFPERADWLEETEGGNSNNNNSLEDSNNNNNNNSDSLSTKGEEEGGGGVSEYRYKEYEVANIQDPYAQVPVGITSSTESTLEALQARKKKEEATNLMNVKSDVTARAQRALSAHAKRSEHFLLADLDPDLDTVLFGTDPVEFEKNVEKMRAIVSTYTKWERWDKFYLYSTRFLQMCCAIFLFLWWEAAQEKQLLRTAAEDYAAQHTHLLKSIEDSRTHAVEYLINEIRTSPPQIFVTAKNTSSSSSSPTGVFAPIAATTAKASKKNNNNNQEEEEEGISRHPMDTRPKSDFQRDKEQVLLERAAVRNSVATDTEFVKKVRRIMLPMSDDWIAVVREEIAAHQRNSMQRLRFPRLSASAHQQQQEEEDQKEEAASSS